MVDAKKPNLKRKRAEGAAKEVDIGTKVAGKLHHELQEIHQACKKAKTFETQKLVKRLKQLREKDDDKVALEDHEAQLTAIKAVDHNKLANTVLKSKAHKDKTLRESDVVQEALKNELKDNFLETPAAGTPQAKVQSRLLSNKIIATQVASSVATIKAIVNPDAPPPAKKARSESPVPTSSSSKPAPAKAKKDKDTLKSKATASAHAEDESDDEAEADDQGWESGTVDEDDEDDESQEEEDSDVDDAGWESGSIHGSDSDDSGDDHDDDEDEEETLRVKARSAKTAKTKSTAESTFLPSLAMGYVSGSDASDIDADEPKNVEPRKNRRGQRARRAIWEKKFGRSANHKKKEMQEFEEKKAKQFAKAKAMVQARMEKPVPKSDAGWGNKGSNAASKPANDKPKGLHPSWEAKRKLKEKESIAIVPSQGKKIKF